MAWFVDWLSGSMPLKGAEKINAGQIVYLRPGGDLEYSIDRRLQVVGSHETTVQVVGDADRLRFTGNPTKYLQGHNLYGGNRIDAVFQRFAASICESLQVTPSPADRAQWAKGKTVTLTRVDLTRMYRPPFAAPGWVPKWLAIASGVAHGGRQRTSNRGMYDANTLYVGANSRRITLKMYDKAAELRRHPIGPAALRDCPIDLTTFAADTLRLEVEVKSMELKDRALRSLAAWNDPAVGDEILDERLTKLELNDRVRMSADELTDLPRRLVLAYHAWRSGADFRLLYSTRTYYRLRADLKAYGIDIAHVQPVPDEEQSQRPMGRPLSDYLAGELGPPDGDPAWQLIAA